MVKLLSTSLVENGNHWDITESDIEILGQDNVGYCAECHQYHLYGDLYEVFLLEGPEIIDKVLDSAKNSALPKTGISK